MVAVLYVLYQMVVINTVSYFELTTSTSDPRVIIEKTRDATHRKKRGDPDSDIIGLLLTVLYVLIQFYYKMIDCLSIIVCCW